MFFSHRFLSSILIRLGIDFGSLWASFWVPKSVMLGIDFLMIFACRLKSAQECPKSAQERPKSAPRAPQERPRSRQERPKRGPRVPKSTPRAPPKRPRTPKNAPRMTPKHLLLFDIVFPSNFLLIIHSLQKLMSLKIIVFPKRNADFCEIAILEESS